MYSNKENINILTALLVQHNVKHVVVCPGSRNSALVHNFNEHPDLICHPVTDERSAGFMALGMSLQTFNRPVAVCVTSGSALLNLLPAVAEATYQKCGIVVISADRPAQWVDQLDGQTLPQQGALGNFVAKSVSLPEPHNDEERWYCARLVNEAFIALGRTYKSVHINVPITEPFFDFTTKELPKVRCTRLVKWEDEDSREMLIDQICSSHRPMVVFGQNSRFDIADEIVEVLAERVPVLYEPLGIDEMPVCLTDQMISVIDCEDKSYHPDLVLYFGGHTVSKRLRQYLRKLPESVRVIMVNNDGELLDVTMHADFVVLGDGGDNYEMQKKIYDNVNHVYSLDKAYTRKWAALRKKVEKAHLAYEPEYSSMLAVKFFEERYNGNTVYYANSMSVRLGSIYADHHIKCNRGLNGIEGSLSTAAGASLAEPDKNVFCVIGDLSFFYDENALWQQQLSGNFRILLLNNNEGAIFRSLKGLEASPVRDTMIAASHNLTAKGICKQFSLSYKTVAKKEELEEGIKWLCTVKSKRPVVLEVITKAEDDQRVYNEYYKSLKEDKEDKAVKGRRRK